MWTARSQPSDLAKFWPKNIVGADCQARPTLFKAMKEETWVSVHHLVALYSIFSCFASQVLNPLFKTAKV